MNPEADDDRLDEMELVILVRRDCLDRLIDLLADGTLLGEELGGDPTNEPRLEKDNDGARTALPDQAR